MAVLKFPPPGPLQSLEEVLAVAQALEKESAAQYIALAEQARDRGAGDLAALFEKLATEERAHGVAVGEWASRAGRDIRWLAAPWPPPDTFDEEGQELAASRTATAYRVLSMAVRNEERTFTFWSYVASEAPTPEVRAAAERMALEELHHVAVLRRARREAYHRERAVRAPDAAWSVADRLRHAMRMEAWLAQELGALALTLEGAERRRAETFRDLAGSAVDRLSPHVRSGGQDASPAPEAPTSPATAAERVVDDYLRVAETSDSEELAGAAQDLAAQSIARLAWLRSLPSGGPGREP